MPSDTREYGDTEDRNVASVHEANSPGIVAVVIVHWRGFETTLDCLRALSAVRYKNLRAIVVDNGSEDFGIAGALDISPDLTIIKSQENLGFAGGSNLGMIRALEEGADYVMLLNNDAFVTDNVLPSVLMPFLHDPSIGIVGPMVMYHDEPEKIWFAGGRLNRLFCLPRHSFHGRHANSDRSPRSGVVDFISGCALIVRREVLMRVGLLWEGYFLYFDDVDFCMRAKEAGFTSYLLAKPVVYHKVSATVGVPGSNKLTKVRAYYYARNPFLLLRRNVTGPRLLTGYIGQLLIALPYNLLKILLGRDWQMVGTYLRGVLDGLRGRTGPTGGLE